MSSFLVRHYTPQPTCRSHSTRQPEGARVGVREPHVPPHNTHPPPPPSKELWAWVMGGGYGRVGDSVPISWRGTGEHNKSPAEHSGRGVGEACDTLALWHDESLSYTLSSFTFHVLPFLIKVVSCSVFFNLFTRFVWLTSRTNTRTHACSGGSSSF